ncbi:MAG: 1-acyl-sn-glycerol-3-phosphate acyltransferase [Saprospiraceae bacterium]
MRAHLIRDIHEWPVYKLSKDRDAFVNEVINDLERQFDQYGAIELDQALSKTIFQERQRIKSNPWKVDPPNEGLFFKKLQNEYNENKESESSFQKNKQSVNRLIHRYTEEISGSFNIATFHFARKILSWFFHFIYLPVNFNLFRSTKTKIKRLSEKLIINGEIDLVRKLFKDNTIILVPTHSSNMDSIMVGYMSDIFGGLPAFTYGAGLNLFDSEFFAFFMNRLGAYRVDRRKKNQIYLHTLSTYTRLIAERGVNTIFFPGGTRSRSGEVESKLKLGLLNSVLLAQRNLVEKKSTRKIILVPVVMTYESVLEARSLMIQHLKLTGQEKFITKERNSPLREYISFIWRLMKKSSKVYLSFATPLDVFGNIVNEQGKSLNHMGTEIDLKDYFLREGIFIKDGQRESIYTKELASAIVDKYKRFNFILPCHLVAYCAFKTFKKLHPGQDEISLVQAPEEEFVIPLEDFKSNCLKLISHLNQLKSQGKALISDDLNRNINLVIKDGVERIGVFHNRKILFIENNQLLTEDLIGLYFYHNKMINLENDFSELC